MVKNEIDPTVYIASNAVIGQIKLSRIRNNENMDSCLPVKIGKNTIIQPGSIIYEDVHIGENCLIGNNVVIREGVRIGNNTTVGTLSRIAVGAVVGNNVVITTQVNITVRAVVEDYCFFGHQVSTMNTKNPTVWRKGKKVIEYPPVFREGCLIGSNATILAGVEIGKNAIVGAGALITKSVPENCKIFSQPAKVK